MNNDNNQAVQETVAPTTDATQPSEIKPAVGTENTQDPATQDPEKPTEHTVPYSRLKEEVEKKRQLERELAALKVPQVDGTDDESVMGHPMFQDAMVKLAEFQLKEGAQEILNRYPQIPAEVKKAILRNPRGFLQPTTQDVPTGLIDIEDYILSEIENMDQQAPQPKTVPVAQNNTGVGKTDGLDAEISKIQAIPSEDWTPEQEKTVNDYLARNRR